MIDPATAIIASSALSAGLNYFNTSQSNSQSSAEASRNRKWQEKMYNQYQSPAAMMRQYREANMNPYLAGQDSLGQGFGFSPSQPDIRPADASSLANVGRDFVNMQANSIASADQKTRQFTDILSKVTDVVNQFGSQQGELLLNSFRPQLRALGYDNVTVDNLFSPVFAQSSAMATIQQVEADWQKEYGSQLRSTNLMKLDQETSEIVARIGLMSSQSALNRQEIRELSTRMARNIAEAFKLKKEGDYYQISADTAKQIQQYVVSQYVMNNGLLGLQFKNGDLDYKTHLSHFNSESGVREFLDSDAAAAKKRAATEFDVEERSDYTHRLLQMSLDDLGKVFHVVGGFNWSNLGGTMNRTFNFQPELNNYQYNPR